ncbi:MAG TPA: RHS repeat-associated core domain-containing protein, partial [Kiritimatiellia bacterium]|nr:RHS repeat-associated core domain-containing protein [Kiritimatiellia bacterium]
VLARSYDRFGRPTGIALGTDYQVAYAYDDVSRFAAITSAVNAVSTAVKYAYVAQSDLLAGWSVGAAPGVANLNVRRFYEPHRDLVATTLVANATGTLARLDYVNDPLGRRIARNDVFAEGTSVSNAFGYNVRSELEAAVMGTNQFGYQYDPIGNRQAAIANEQTVQYVANALNQYASILPAAGTPTYDADGNMTSDGTFTYSWDAENRLVEVRPATTNVGSMLMQCMYDHLGRRVGKRVFAWSTFGDHDDWHWTDSRYFTYDGWNLIEERKPSARPTTMVPYIPLTNTTLLGMGGATAANYVWGLDMAGSLQGAGGVGGLLARSAPESSDFDYAYCDANGNVTGLVDTNGNVVARYDYDPYGNLLAQSGDQAEANPFRFSSKLWDGETELYYYGYRFYSPETGRWLNRDPIEEGGGLNIYAYVDNDSLSRYDILGFWGPNVHHIATRDWAQGLGYPSDAAEAIGLADEAVDHGSTSWSPVSGDQSYHFDMNKGVGADSRMQHYQRHLKAALDACTDPVDDPLTAANQLGTALHPYQDWVAHGEYGMYDKGGIYSPHNWQSPQARTWGNVSDYPDNVRLDAVNGPNGRPAGLAMHTVIVNFGQSIRSYAIYQPGTRRISLTRDMTTSTLNGFRDYVKRSAVPACKCRKYFGVP